MNQEVDEEEYGLSSEELEKLQTIVDNHLKNKLYDDTYSSQIINDILEELMEQLHSIKRPYKYIANCMLSQRLGTGLSNFTSAYWDKTMDFVYHIYYPKDKNYTGKDRPQIFGLVTICCISYSTKS
jgi:dynein light chain Tctex-type 1